MFTISKDEFSKIHNAKCSLHSVIGRLDGIVSEKITEDLKKVLTGIDQALRNAYDQEEKDFDAKSSHYESVSKQSGFRSIWSNYDVADMNSKHPFPEAHTLLYANHWEGAAVRAGILGDTWVDLYRAADQCIKLSGDKHHIFIEDFTADQTEEGVLVLSTGS